MGKRLSASAAIVLFCGIINVASYAADATVQATSAATAWLKLVDDGDYAGSWQHASALFQNNVSSDAWSQKVAAVRDSLGPVVSRKLVGTQTASSLPGVPDGQYVVLNYDSSIKNKSSAVEIVTSMLEKNGEWRVAGYFIK
jgi:hypothetical protein